MEGLTRKIWLPCVKAPSTVYAETGESVARQIEKGGGVVLEIEGASIGSGRWVPVPGPNDTRDMWMEIKRIGVLPDFTGQGLGEKILTSLEEQGRSAGAVGAQLAVRYDQLRLVEYYAANGYQTVDDVVLTTINTAAPPPVGMRKLF